jgi:ribonuclease P protein component
MNGSIKSNTLDKKEILRGQKVLDQLFRNGREYRNKYLRFVYKRNTLLYDRILISVSKRYGNSCFRNYVRRSIKDIFRTNRSRLKTGYDIAILLLNRDFAGLDHCKKESLITTCLSRILE